MGIISYFKKRAAAKRKAKVISNTKPSSSPVTYSTSTGGSTNVVKPSSTTSGGGGGSSGGGGTVTQEVLEPKKVAPVMAIDLYNKKTGGQSSVILRNKLITQRKIRQAILNKKIQQSQFIKKVSPTVIKTADFVSGGAIIKRNIKKEQEKINQQVKYFNQRYGNRPLSESEYNRALIESANIEANQKLLEEEQQSYKKSPAKKFGDFFTGRNFEEAIEPTAKNIKFEEKQLSDIKKQIAKRKSKGKAPTKIQIELLKNSQNRVDILKSGGSLKVKMAKGAAATFLTPAGIGSKVSKIKFVGKQTKQGNKILTDLEFITADGKRVGVAKGVTVQKGKNGYTIVAGASGKTRANVIKFGKRWSKKFTKLKKSGASPSQILKTQKRFVKSAKKVSKKNLKGVKRIRSFIGEEGAVAKASRFDISDEIKLLRKKKSLGIVNRIKKNVDGVSQKSRGAIASVKGKKFFRRGVEFPSGKFVKKKSLGIRKDEFASMSAIFSKGDISKIVGKTITAKGNKAKFIGIIKGEKNVQNMGKFSAVQKTQYKKALERVLALSAASISKTNKVRDLTKPQRIAVATNLIKNAIKQKPSGSTQELTNLIKGTGTIQKSENKGKVIVKGISKGKSKSKSIQKSLSKVKQQIKQKSLQKQTPKQNQRLKQLQRQRLKLSQKLLQEQKLKLKTPKIKFSVRGRGRTKILSLALRKKPKVRGIKKKLSPIQAFNVYAKSGKKFIKINKKPLKRNDALNKGTYAIDNTTSKQFKIISAGRLKKVGKIPKKERNYFNRAGYKLREFKVRKGRKFQIKPRYIERTRYGIDTKGEKRGLTISKYLKQGSRKRKVTSRRPSSSRRSPTKRRRISSQQRKVMLQNLAKARRVLAKKRGKRR